MAEEVGDLVAVAIPGRLGRIDLRGVATLGGLQKRDRAGDVLLQQPRQLVAGGIAIERLDRIADIDLVAQKPRLGRREIRQIAGEADDREPRPGDVVLPQLAHPVVQDELLARLRGDGVVMHGAGRGLTGACS